MEQTEELSTLIERTAAGDRQAYAALYRATAPRLYAIALRMLRAADQAEDVTQQAYLLIWRKADRYKAERGPAFAWMAAIVRNCAIDVLRARAPQAEPLPEQGSPHEPACDADADILWAQVRTSDRLRRCLGQLPEQQRRCILLAYYSGMTHEQIAEAMGAPLGSVKSWVRRGLIKLKECLGE